MTSDSGKHAGPRHEGPARTSPYPVSRLSAPHDLVELAEQIQRADEVLKSVVGGKLEQIARQMRALQEQARQALADAQRDADLHRAACAFRKRPGDVYHLYERERGTRYFSMLSPDDWGGKPPHRHLGSYRLEADMGWTPLEAIAERDQERQQLMRLLPSDPG